MLITPTKMRADVKTFAINVVSKKRQSFCIANAQKLLVISE